MDVDLLRRGCEAASIEVRNECADGSRASTPNAYLIGAGWVPINAECVETTVASRLVAKVWRKAATDAGLGARFEMLTQSPYAWACFATDEQRIRAALKVLCE